jgi:putative FmdB family regulatory protein
MDRIKGTLGASEEEQTFDYHCRECDTEFQSTSRSISEVACPTCGASGARSVLKL